MNDIPKWLEIQRLISEASPYGIRAKDILTSVRTTYVFLSKVIIEWGCAGVKSHSNQSRIWKIEPYIAMYLPWHYSRLGETAWKQTGEVCFSGKDNVWTYVDPDGNRRTRPIPMSVKRKISLEDWLEKNTKRYWKGVDREMETRLIGRKYRANVCTWTPEHKSLLSAVKKAQRWSESCR